MTPEEAAADQRRVNAETHARMRQEGTVANAFRDTRGTPAQRAAWAEQLRRATEEPRRQLAPIELEFLVGMQIDEPKALVGSLVREGSLGMIHAPAGVGKTFFSLGIAISLAHGVPFLGYPVATAESVLYVDGEMSAYDMRERSRLLALPFAQSRERKRFFVVTPDLHTEGIPKVDCQEGADALLSLVDIMKGEIRLIVLDNLACLTRPDGDDSHGARSFGYVQDLMLALRSRNVACWIVHHSGKNGEQRGTSKRGDVLDVILRLSALPTPGDGRTQIAVTFEKGRHMKPEEKAEFIACLEPDPTAGLIWTRSSNQLPVRDRAIAMLRDGMPPGDVANELKTGRSYVYRLRAELAENGELPGKRTEKTVPYQGTKGTRKPGDKSGDNAGDTRGQRYEY